MKRNQPLLTTRDAANMIGCSLSHVLTLVKQGKLKARKCKSDCNQHGYRLMIVKSSAEAYAKTTFKGHYPRGRARVNS